MPARALALAGAAVAAASAGCTAPAPLGVTPLVALDCATPGATLNVIFYTADPNTGGYFYIDKTALCVTARQQGDGSYALAVAQCFYPAHEPDELFAPLLDGSVVSHINGQCVDVQSGKPTGNQTVVLRACDGGAGQRWRPDDGGHIVNGWGACMGTC
jgi:hypothetical protein